MGSAASAGAVIATQKAIAASKVMPLFICPSSGKNVRAERAPRKSVDKVNATKNQKQVTALPCRQATDFCAFPPGKFS